MQFLKTHLISLLCGVATAVFIVVAVLGMVSTSVRQEMREKIKQTGAPELPALRADPKNEKIIQAEQRQAREFEREYQATLKAAHDINRRAPLMSGVFPRPAKRSTGFEFVQVYQQALRGLSAALMAGTLPTAAEVEEERQNVNDLLALEAEQQEQGGGKAPAITRRQFAPGRGVAAAPEAGVPVAAGRGFGRRSPGPRGVALAGPGMGVGVPARASSNEPKYDPRYRANVTKAKSIRCYIEPPIGPELPISASFHVSPIVDATSAPPPEELWFAQVGLWIQRDVVAALARLNKQAAQQVAGGEACVEQMPVKRLELLRVLGYQTPAGLVPFPAAGSAAGGDVIPSFTGQVCNDQYDVVRFVLVAVVDQRDTLKLIDQISKQNFYQCIGAGYSAVGPVDAQQGYLYGTEPAVRVRLDFEGYLARAIYQPLMPPAVAELLGAGGDEEG